MGKVLHKDKHLKQQQIQQNLLLMRQFLLLLLKIIMCLVNKKTIIKMNLLIN